MLVTNGEEAVLACHAVLLFRMCFTRHFLFQEKKNITAPRMKTLMNEHLLGPLPVCMSNA